jgi:hypothetical protein
LARCVHPNACRGRVVQRMPLPGEDGRFAVNDRFFAVGLFVSAVSIGLAGCLSDSDDRAREEKQAEVSNEKRWLERLKKHERETADPNKLKDLKRLEKDAEKKIRKLEKEIDCLTILPPNGGRMEAFGSGASDAMLGYGPSSLSPTSVEWPIEPTSGILLAGRSSGGQGSSGGDRRLDDDDC